MKLKGEAVAVVAGGAVTAAGALGSRIQASVELAGDGGAGLRKNMVGVVGGGGCRAALIEKSFPAASACSGNGLSSTRWKIASDLIPSASQKVRDSDSKLDGKLGRQVRLEGNRRTLRLVRLLKTLAGKIVRLLSCSERLNNLVDLLNIPDGKVV